MKLASSIVFILFWALLCTDCLFIFNRLDDYRFYSKPFIIPALYMFLAFETADTTHRRTKTIVSLSLLFAMIGDILLLFEGEKTYFTLGLLCFLIAYLFYTLFFFRIKHFSLKNLLPLLLVVAGVIILQCLLLPFVWKRINEGGLGWQIIAYCASITLMFAGAFNATAGKRAGKAAWKYFMPGVFLFFLSDSLLAVSKFYPFVAPPRDLLAGLNCAVMLTYGCAQLLLVTGAIKFIK